MLKKQKYSKQLWSRQSPLLVSTHVKISLIFILCLLIALLAAYVALQQYSASLINRNETVSRLIDPEKVKTLINDSRSASTNETYLEQQLQQAKSVSSDVMRYYLLTSTKAEDVTYVVDSSATKSTGKSYENESDRLDSSFYSPESTLFNPFSNKKGTFITVISPFYDEQGKQIAVIGMDVKSSTYFSVLATAFLIPIFAALLLSGIFLTTDMIRRRRQESIRMRSELVSIASHELRTPLTGIRWGEELLLGTELATTNRTVLQAMYDSTLRLQESIEDILQLANWQAGSKQELLISSTDIGAIVEGIFATQKLPANQKDIRLEVDPKWPEQLMIDCDAQRIRRVLNNLISNAIKYSYPNTAIIVGYEKVDGKHVITIKDHGIGIPEEEQKEVFAGFYRASNAMSKESNGTGMGLYMSRSAVEQHGGKLWLHSEENKGTTVFIQLP
jgi:signal transduction histidine kinase